MTTESQLRKAARGLPEVEETTRSGMIVFSVRRQEFAALAGDGRVELHLTAADAEVAMGTHEGAERLVRGGANVGICVPLADVDGQKLNHLVRRAWFSQAPEQLAQSLADAESVSPGEVGDLPAGIGRPATRALAGAGITTLDQVATRTEQELLSMHGVGPRAVRILVDALVERGQAIRRHPG